MMNISEKKVLALWMGFEIGNSWNGVSNRPCIRTGRKTKREAFNECISMESWHPDTDHKQFAEVLRKFEESNFSEKQAKIMSESFRGLNPKNDAYFTIYLCVADNMSKVIQAVLEVIKEGK